MNRLARPGVAVALSASTLALSLTVAHPSAAATGLSDGGFESPTVAGGFTGYTTGQQIGAWTVESGSVDHIGTTWPGAVDGKQSVDLNGSSVGTLCQTVTTTANAPYRVDYYMSNNPSLNGPATMNVVADGTVIDSASHSGATAATMNWTLHSKTFTADNDGQTKLCFASTTTDATHGPALDEVSLTALNQPPTATITKPANASTYFQGESANTVFNCVDPDGTVSTCVDGAGHASGGFVDTATPGGKTFTVTATDNLGATGQASTGYTVKQLFTGCRGLAAGITLLRVSDANPGRTPCVATHQVVASKSIPLLLGTLEVGTLGAATATPQPGVEQAMGSISAMHLSLLGLDIKADELTSAAQSTMGAGCSAVNSVGRSHVGRFTVNGKAIEIGSAPFVLKLPLGLGAIYLNQQVTTATSIVQRALFVDLPGTFLDVVLGQASTGASCDGAVKIASAIKHGPKPTKAQIKSVKARLQKLGNRSF